MYWVILWLEQVIWVTLVENCSWLREVIMNFGEENYDDLGTIEFF